MRVYIVHVFAYSACDMYNTSRNDDDANTDDDAIMTASDALDAQTAGRMRYAQMSADLMEHTRRLFRIGSPNWNDWLCKGEDTYCKAII